MKCNGQRSVNKHNAYRKLSTNHLQEKCDALEKVLRQRMAALYQVLIECKGPSLLINTSGEIKNPFGTTKFKLIEFFVVALKHGGPVSARSWEGRQEREIAKNTRQRGSCCSG